MTAKPGTSCLFWPKLPTLSDVNLAGSLGNDSRNARFSGEAFQETYTSFVKSITTRPVVGVGRFTSPETMPRQIRGGLLDFIGAARPSIADPFLPRKIREGREDEIRECIGCNICRAANNEAVPLRCKQNATMGEEWRRGWHPARITPKSSNKRVLVVGGGPAGKEAALALGQRGYDVARESDLSFQDIIDFGADHVVVATGSHWRRDAVGTARERPIRIPAGPAIVTPDSAGALSDAVLIYDDDNYYMGGALAEKLALEGRAVAYVTTQPVISAWTQMTDEQQFIEERLVSLGVKLHVSHLLEEAEEGLAAFHVRQARDPMRIEFGSLILVTGRVPQDDLYTELTSRNDAPPATRIGDCHSPSHIADAVYAGHRFAREFDLADVPMLRRERPEP